MVSDDHEKAIEAVYNSSARKTVSKEDAKDIKEEEDKQKLKNFLRQRWPIEYDGANNSNDIEAWVTLTQQEIDGTFTVVNPYQVTDVGLDALITDAINRRDTSNLWLSVCGFGGRVPGKGTEKLVSAIPCLWADIDTKDLDGRDPVELLYGLGEFAPSSIVFTGHGVQAYWLFDEVVDFNPLTDVATLYAKQAKYRVLTSRWHTYLCQTLNAKFDNVSNLDRVMRLPFTRNFKDVTAGTGDAIATRIINTNDNRFSLDSLIKLLDDNAIPVNSSGIPQSSQEIEKAFALQGSLEYQASLRECNRWLLICLDKANAGQSTPDGKSGRDNWGFYLAQQLNDHYVDRNIAEGCLNQYQSEVTEYDTSGKLDPLPSIFARQKVDSAYSYPPRGPASNPTEKPKLSLVPISANADNPTEERDSSYLLVGGTVENPHEVNGSWHVISDDGSAAVRNIGTKLDVLDGLGQRRNTDVANAVRFKRIFGDSLKWSTDDTWYLWNNRYWEEDKKLQRKMMIRQLALDIAADCENPSLTSEEIRQTRRHALALESETGQNNLIRQLKVDLAVDPNEFDSDPWLLNCPNGTLDLKTGILSEHKQSDLITRMCPTPYEHGATNERLSKFLSDVQRDVDILNYLQMFLGYCLTGLTVEDAVLVLTGITRTGKSTFMEPFVRMMGDVDSGGYATTLPARVFSRSSIEGKEEKLAKLQFARFATIPELENGVKLADSFLKQITGGDSFDAKKLYKGSMTLRARAKLIIYTNYIPKSTDPAVHKRLKIVPFRHQIKDDDIDTSLKHYLIESPDVHKAMLAWVVEGCKLWQQNGKLANPDFLKEELSSYIVKSDLIVMFMHDCLEETESVSESIDIKSCYELFRTWSADRGIAKPFSKITFNEKMVELGIQKQRFSGILVWMNYAPKVAPQGDYNLLNLED